MFKDAYKRKYDRIVPDPTFRRALEERIEDMRNQEKRRWMRRSLAAVVVLTAMLALTTVGFATGIYRSVFVGMRSHFGGDPVVDYDHMNQQAATGFEHRSIAFENGVQVDVGLEQSYYNGQQLAMGWSLKMDESEIRFLEKDDPLVAQAEECDWTITLQEHLGAEGEAEFVRRVQQDGWAGVVWYDCWLSDQSYLADISGDVDPTDGLIYLPEEAWLRSETDARWQEQDGARISYQECETPLPEAAQEKNSIRVARKITCARKWFIFDGERSYNGSDELERAEVVFEIPISEEYAERVYYQDGEFPEFTANVTLIRTPIRAEFEIVNQVSKEWEAMWGSHEGYLHVPLNLADNLVFDYEILVDGKGVEFKTIEYNGTLGIKGWFLLPADAKQVVFRPVYANSGANADEDMVVRME